MEDLNRRSAMALGLTAAAAVPLVALARPAGAAEIVPAYGPNDGEELSPGVRMVEVGTWDSDMTGIKSVQVLDIIYQPGAADVEEAISPANRRPSRIQSGKLAGGFSSRDSD